MNVLVTAIADLVKTFCSGVVSLVTVPAQVLQNSFGSAVYALPLVLKTKGMPKLLNNNKKGG